MKKETNSSNFVMKKISILTFSILSVFLFSNLSHSADAKSLKKSMNKKAAIFSSMHKKASRNLVNVAQDKVFVEYFSTTDKAEKKRLKKEIEQKILKVQKNFKVDEMCLIDAAGHEKCRIVHDEIAPDSDLSPDEGSAPFFKPSFEVAGKKVYVADPYLSADSLRWVIAYTTPIVMGSGKKAAILHYEMPLSNYQDDMSKGYSGKDDYIIIVGNKGRLWADSRKTYKLSGDPENAPESKFFPIYKDAPSNIVSALKGNKAGEDTFTNSGKSYTIVYKPLNYFDWTIAIVSAK